MSAVAADIDNSHRFSDVATVFLRDGLPLKPDSDVCPTASSTSIRRGLSAGSPGRMA
jgi:hypothetical protein